MDEESSLLKELEYWTKLIHAHKQKGSTQTTYSTTHNFNKNRVRGNKTWVNKNMQAAMTPQACQGTRKANASSQLASSTQARTVLVPKDTTTSTFRPGNKKVSTAKNAIHTSQRSISSNPTENVFKSQNSVWRNRDRSLANVPVDKGRVEIQPYKDSVKTGAVSSSVNSKREVKISAKDGATGGIKTQSKRTVKLPNKSSNTSAEGSPVKTYTTPTDSTFLKKGKYSLIKKVTAGDTISYRSECDGASMSHTFSGASPKYKSATVLSNDLKNLDVPYDSNNSGSKSRTAAPTEKSQTNCDIDIGANTHTLNVSFSKPSKRTVINPMYKWVAKETEPERSMNENGGRKVKGHIVKHTTYKHIHKGFDRSLSNSSSGSSGGGYKESPSQVVAKGLVSKYKKINPSFKIGRQQQQQQTSQGGQSLGVSEFEKHSSTSTPPICSIGVKPSLNLSPKYQLVRKIGEPYQEHGSCESGKAMHSNRTVTVKSKYSLIKKQVSGVHSGVKKRFSNVHERVKGRVTGSHGNRAGHWKTPSRKKGQQKKKSKYCWINTGNQDNTIQINKILGRKVKNFSKNRYKFIGARTLYHANSVPKLTQKYIHRQLRNNVTSRTPQKSQLKLDNRSPEKKSPESASKKLSETQRLVVIGGLVYRSSRTSLNRTHTSLNRTHTSLNRTHTSLGSVKKKHHRNQFVVKRLNTNKMKTVTVRGVKFNMDPSGKTLQRVSNSLIGSPMKGAPVPASVSSNSSVKRVDIGGVTYIQSKPGTLVRVVNSQNRKIASHFLHKSITTAVHSKYKKQKQKYCMFYNRFGKCKRGEKCPYIHDKDKIAICTRYLRGTCKVKGCPFSHQVRKEKMPVCSFFLRGVCNKDDCPYLHVNVSRGAAVCEDFLHGFCPLGEKCKKRHSLLCPDFSVSGHCPRGKKCKMQHRKRAPPSQDKQNSLRHVQDKPKGGARGHTKGESVHKRHRVEPISVLQHSTPIANLRVKCDTPQLDVSVLSSCDDDEEERNLPMKKRKMNAPSSSLPSFISLTSDTSLGDGEENEGTSPIVKEKAEDVPLKIKPRFSDSGLE